MRAYMFTASSSPASIATSLAAIRKLAAEPERRDRLRANSARLFEGFRALGLDMGCDMVSPVIAVKCADEASTIAMWNALLDAGVYVNIALPPGTPASCACCAVRCRRRTVLTTSTRSSRCLEKSWRAGPRPRLIS